MQGVIGLTTLIRSSLAVALIAMAAGCGGQPASVSTQKLNQMVQGNTDDDQRAKIKAALEKAGVKGEIALIEDAGKSWSVEVSPPSGPDGKGRKTGGLAFRPAYNVDKTTFNVVGNEKKGGGASTN